MKYYLLFLYILKYFFSKNYLLSSFSSETVKLLRPLALLVFKIFLPFFVAILALKPCLLTLFRLDGWNVLFIIYLYFFKRCKNRYILYINKKFLKKYLLLSSTRIKYIFSGTMQFCLQTFERKFSLADSVDEGKIKDAQIETLRKV